MAKKKGTTKPKKAPKPRKSRKTAAEKLAEIDYIEISKINNVKQLEKMFTTLRRGYTIRKKTLERKFGFIPAVEGIEKYRNVFKGTLTQLRKKFATSDAGALFKKGTPEYNAAFANVLRSNINQYQQFFRNQTSTVEGNLKWRDEQDKKIFGINSEGKVNYIMSEEERKKFWSAYNEWMKFHPEHQLESDRIQNIIMNIFVNASDGKKKSFGGNNADLLAEITAMYTINEDFDIIGANIADELEGLMESLNYGGIPSDLLIDYAEQVANNVAVDTFPTYTDDMLVLVETIKTKILNGEFDRFLGGVGLYGKGTANNGLFSQGRFPGQR